VVSVGINQRISLRKFIDDVRRWVDEGRSDDWIASALGTSPSSVQSFRSRNGIYRKDVASSPLADPEDYAPYEGVLEKNGPEGPGAWFDPAVGDDARWKRRWERVERVEVRVSPDRIVLLPRGKRPLNVHHAGTNGHSADGTAGGASAASAADLFGSGPAGI
jgi:hypothetical protein